MAFMRIVYGVRSKHARLRLAHSPHGSHHGCTVHNDSLQSLQTFYVNQSLRLNFYDYIHSYNISNVFIILSTNKT